MLSKAVSSGKTLVFVRDVDNGPGSLRPAPSPQVLDEDVYTEKIDQIVQKNYFPDLPKLKAQADWISAARRQDIVTVAEIKNNEKQMGFFNRLLGKTEEGVGDTAKISTNLDEKRLPAEQEVRTDMSLDEFIVKYISEDDASFCKLIEKESTASKKRLWYMEEMNRKNMKILESSHVPRTICASDSRIALMNFPENINTGDHQSFSKFDREIRRENTRFTGSVWKSSKSPALRDKDGFLIPQGKEASSRSENDSKDISIYQRMNHARQRGEMAEYPPQSLSQSPRSDTLHSFVTIPSPNPHTGQQSPFITWGGIDTPLLLDERGNPAISSDELGSIDDPYDGMATIPEAYGFHIHQQSQRQQVANRLARKVSLSKKKIENADNRTPLLVMGEAIKQKSPFPGSFGSFEGSKMSGDIDSQLRASYSPMVKSGQNTPKSIKSDTDTPKTRIS